MESNSILDQHDGGYKFNKILSRKTSIGQSSRIYYRDGDHGEVPFKWEKQPGTPMNPPKKEVIPPPTPPPAIQCLGLPKPCVDQVRESTFSRYRIQFWKNKNRHKKSQQGYTSKSAKVGYADSERFDFGYSNEEFPVDHPRLSYSSSSSSSLSSTNSRQLHPSRFRKGISQRLPVYCIPWSLSDMLDRIQRRV